MRIFFKDSFAILVLVLLIFPSISAIAQICKPSNIPATTPINRFWDNGDGTITDKKTGLMWKKCPEGLSGIDCGMGGAISFTWQDALKRAQNINTSGGFAGYTDWRVPNINEILSIAEEQCVDPAINLTIFPNTPSIQYRSFFWSSSLINYNNCMTYAWGVDFYNGSCDLTEKTNACGNKMLRLVRN